MSNLNRYGKKYLIPLASCLFTTGAKRALLCDLQRQRFMPVPMSLKDLVTDYKGKRIEEMYADYPEEEHPTLEEYLDFLLEGEYIFLSNTAADAERFIDLPLDFLPSGKIQNAIIDVDGQSSFDLHKIIAELISLDCIAIQVRSYRLMELEEILDITNATANSNCRNIEFIIPYSENIAGNSQLEEAFIAHQRIGSIICYDAPENRSDWYLGNQIRVDYIMQHLSDETHCGVFHLSYFSPNIPHFTEAQLHNTCLNQKISVDRFGQIKNCPGMATAYGDINDTSLSSVLARSDFKKMWTIHKDEIRTCKDCEFRYICTDCRAYLEDPADDYSKPLKCGYDPYTASWEDWSKNPLKQSAILSYGFKFTAM